MADTKNEGEDYLRNTSGGVWDLDDPMRALVDADDHPDGYPVPAWIDQEITGSTVLGIRQGGCASGAYMPAVTYDDARQIMAEHGDDVLDYIWAALGEIPGPEGCGSWSGIACFYLASAVELWAANSRDTLDCGV